MSAKLSLRRPITPNSINSSRPTSSRQISRETTALSQVSTALSRLSTADSRRTRKNIHLPPMSKRKKSLFPSRAKSASEVSEVSEGLWPRNDDYEPVFSARLGRKASIPRSYSTDSVDTDISLLSVSTLEIPETKHRRRRRFRHGHHNDVISPTSERITSGFESTEPKEIEIGKRVSRFDDINVQTLLFECMDTSGICNREKSLSLSDLASLDVRIQTSSEIFKSAFIEKRPFSYSLRNIESESSDTPMPISRSYRVSSSRPSTRILRSHTGSSWIYTEDWDTFVKSKAETEEALQRKYDFETILEIVAAANGEYVQRIEEEFEVGPRIKMSEELKTVIQNTIRRKLSQPVFADLCPSSLTFRGAGRELTKREKNVKVFNWLVDVSRTPIDNTEVDAPLQPAYSLLSIRTVDYPTEICDLPL